MKSCTRGVYQQIDLIFDYGKLDLMPCTRFLKPINIVNALEPLDNGLFDNRLTVAHAEKIGIDGKALYGELVIFGNPLFPRQFLRSLKQVLKAMRLERTEIYVNTLGKP